MTRISEDDLRQVLERPGYGLDGTAGRAPERLVPRYPAGYVLSPVPGRSPTRPARAGSTSDVAETGSDVAVGGQAGTAPKPKPGKYNNVRTLGPAPWGGEIEYASADEAKFARELETRRRAGLSRGWGMQLSFVIGMGPRGFRRHKVDFYEVEMDGRLRPIERKGHDHAGGKSRRADLVAMGTPVEVRRS